MSALPRAQQSTVIQNEKIFCVWDYIIFAVLTVVNAGALLLFLYYWFSQEDWKYSTVPFLLMTFVFFLNMSMYYFRWLSLPSMRRPRPMPALRHWKVGVATTFVPGAESITMLEQTLKALVAMDYPHDTWVLDEGDDEHVKHLCRRYGAHHFSRRAMPQYQTEAGTFERRTKHGNYNAWLHEIGFDRYEIIVTFDPDHIPYPHFLTRSLGYFDDPSVGYVQAAQAYYNQPASFIARGAAEETYAYYSSIQMVNYVMGQPIVTGCHTSHRGTALKQVGGLAPHEADDLLITILYRAAGWRGIYVPEILAKGLTPVDWSGYLTQQRRWARSVFDIKFRIYPSLVGKLPLLEKLLSFLHGLYYFQGISIILSLLVLAFMLVTGVTPRVFSYASVPYFAFLMATIQLCELYRQRFYLDFKREWGFHWRAGILRAAKWPFFLYALRDALAHYQGGYTITRKTGGQTMRRMLLAPHLTVAGVIGMAWAIGMVLGRITNPALHLGAAAAIGGSLLVIATEWLSFPDPYDPNLYEAQR